MKAFGVDVSAGRRASAPVPPVAPVPPAPPPEALPLPLVSPIASLKIWSAICSLTVLSIEMPEPVSFKEYSPSFVFVAIVCTQAPFGLHNQRLKVPGVLAFSTQLCS
ncbi:hypothetical protein, partial [Methyloceanibacter sp.]|uniref:hypothetical protein n=1 Tax=Methyloceanibacter sp. TaxID=1965321 RepID=UPI00351BC8D4